MSLQFTPEQLYLMQQMYAMQQQYAAQYSQGRYASESYSQYYQRPSRGPGPFDVPLNAYRFQPWTNPSEDPSQWFNYDLDANSWSQYAQSQLRNGAPVVPHHVSPHMGSSQFDARPSGRGGHRGRGRGRV